MGEATQLLQATIEFLRKHAPFNEMDDASLTLLATSAKMGYHGKGAAIVAPSSGISRTLYIIQRGLVHAAAPGAGEGNRIEWGPGEAFPISAVLGQRATTLQYVAAEDVFAYEIDADTTQALMARSLPFQRFCTRHMGTLLAQAAERLRNTYSQQTLGTHSLLAPLGSTIRRKPVTCAPETPLLEALQTMQKNKVSAIVIADGEGRPRGIFTERDLVRHTAAGEVDRARAMTHYMTPDPIGLPVTATASEAALVMAQRNIRHLLICDEGRLVGVVSERGLFALQRLSMREVTQIIEMAGRRARRRSAASRRTCSRRASARSSSPSSSPRSTTSSRSASSCSRLRATTSPASPSAGWRWAARAATSRRSPPTRTTPSCSPPSRARRRACDSGCCRSRAP
jgi:CBS domain-containing protein